MLKFIAVVLAACALASAPASAQSRASSPRVSPPVLAPQTPPVSPQISQRLAALAQAVSEAARSDPALSEGLLRVQTAAARQDAAALRAAFTALRAPIASERARVSALLSELQSLPGLPPEAGAPEALAIVAQSEQLSAGMARETLAILAALDTLAAEAEADDPRTMERVSLALMQNGLSSLRRTGELLRLQTLQTEALLGPDPAALAPVAAAQALAAAMQADFEAAAQRTLGEETPLEALAAAEAEVEKRVAEAEASLGTESASARAFVEALPAAERTQLLNARLAAFSTAVEARLSAARLMRAAVAQAHADLRSGVPPRDAYQTLAGQFRTAAPAFDRATQAYFEARQELAIEFERYR